MVDMASKNSSSCTVSYTPPSMKTDLLYLRSPMVVVARYRMLCVVLVLKRILFSYLM